MHPRLLMSAGLPWSSTGVVTPKPGVHCLSYLTTLRSIRRHIPHILLTRQRSNGEGDGEVGAWLGRECREGQSLHSEDLWVCFAKSAEFSAMYIFSRNCPLYLVVSDRRTALIIRLKEKLALIWNVPAMSVGMCVSMVMLLAPVPQCVAA